MDRNERDPLQTPDNAKPEDDTKTVFGVPDIDSCDLTNLSITPTEVERIETMNSAQQSAQQTGSVETPIDLTTGSSPTEIEEVVHQDPPAASAGFTTGAPDGMTTVEYAKQLSLLEGGSSLKRQREGTSARSPTVVSGGGLKLNFGSATRPATPAAARFVPTTINQQSGPTESFIHQGTDLTAELVDATLGDNDRLATMFDMEPVLHKYTDADAAVAERIKNAPELYVLRGLLERVGGFLYYKRKFPGTVRLQGKRSGFKLYTRNGDFANFVRVVYIKLVEFIIPKDMKIEEGENYMTAINTMNTKIFDDLRPCINMYIDQGYIRSGIIDDGVVFY